MNGSPNFAAVKRHLLLLLLLVLAGTAGLVAQPAMITDTAWVNYTTANSELPVNFVSDIEVAADGTVWIATWGGGLVRIQEGIWTIYDENNSGLPNNLINSIAFDKEGVLWLATDGDLTRFDGTNWKTIRMPVSENIILVVQVDAYNRVWAGTYDQGLYRYDGRKLEKMWGGYKSMDYGVNDILFDNDGNTWLATRIGMLRYDGKAWSQYNQENTAFTGDAFYRLGMDSKGDVWAATYPPGNYARWDGSNWAMFSEQQPAGATVKDFPGNYIYAMEITEGDEVLGGSQYHGALSLFDGRQIEGIATPLSPEDMGVSSLALDNDGNIWVGSWKRGFFFLENPEQRVSQELVDSLAAGLFLDREIRRQKDVVVNSPKVELLVWDSKKVDGDTVSVSLNGEWVIKDQLITAEPIRVSIRLKRNFDNHLILYAENLGRTPPNTATLAILDKGHRHSLILKSDLRKSGTVVIRYDPDEGQ